MTCNKKAVQVSQNFSGPSFARFCIKRDAPASEIGAQSCRTHSCHSTETVNCERVCGHHNKDVSATSLCLKNKDFEEGFKDLFQNIYKELFHSRRTRREEVGIHLFQKSNR